MNAVETGKTVVRYAFRTLRLTPMHAVLRRLKRSGVPPETLSTLEVFGCDGEHHTLDLASIVDKMEIWEINPQWKPVLKRRFPRAQIKITDSYAEVERTSNRYDLVVVDNADRTLNHYEHFDLFPSILRVLADPAVLIVNVWPRADAGDPARLGQRQAFYRAADPRNISFDEIERTYRGWATEHGWTVSWMFYQRRLAFSPRALPVYYAVLRLARTPTTADQQPPIGVACSA